MSRVVCDMSGSTFMAWLVVAGQAAVNTLRGSTRRLSSWRPVSRWRRRPVSWRPGSAARALRPERLHRRFSCSQRQARRYAGRAAGGGPVEAPQPATVFTVKLPVQLAARVREHAAASGRTISWVVTQALEEFLSRGRREHPRK